MRGIDYLLMRSDGVSVIDAYEVISTGASNHISVHAQGYITPPPEMQMPPPEVILSPEFQWPDVPLPLHGFALYRTGVEDFGWMNRTAMAFEGTVNVGTGKLLIEALAQKTEATGRPGSATM